tara:strand:- start:315 stop:608 length:294 start_codon:yes stop_codon:yes gene_type:complete
MKVQITQRGDFFYARRKGFFGYHKYLAIHGIWWTSFFSPNERYYGFVSIEKAKTCLEKHAQNTRDDKKFLEDDKRRRRLNKNLKMTVIEEIEIDVGD